MADRAAADAVDVALLAAATIEEVGGEYFVGGSIASSLQGEPRATNDVDFVLSLPFGRLEAFKDALGADFEVDVDMLRAALRTAGSASCSGIARAARSPIGNGGTWSPSCASAHVSSTEPIWTRGPSAWGCKSSSVALGPMLRLAETFSARRAKGHRARSSTDRRAGSCRDSSWSRRPRTPGRAGRCTPCRPKPAARRSRPAAAAAARS